jgi:8-hydroxy-5-deazaflavin:NADPH oxidoreductase
MQIAIIGAGNVGRALAGSLTKAGHDVTVSAPHADHAREVATETGANAEPTINGALSDADLVVLAVPATALSQVAEEYGEKLSGKVVVDVANRPTPSPDGPPTSIAEELQAKLPAASVVKAFNTIFATRQADPDVGGVPADAFVAADDPSAKQLVLDLVESIGFRPVDAGPLAAARTLEGMAWLNINRNIAGGSWQNAWVILEPKAVPTPTSGG